MEELIIREQETREKIVQVLNEANLPACMLEPILKEMYEQVSKLKDEQYKNALINKEQRENKEKDKKASK